MKILTERTQDEIVAKIKEWEEADFFGVRTDRLMVHLDHRHAKPWLKDSTTKTEWEKATADTLLPADAIKDYLPFAWGKALGERGLSAARSLDHMVALLWLDSNDKLYNEMLPNGAVDIEYDDYGKDWLRKIAKAYDVKLEEEK